MPLRLKDIKMLKVLNFSQIFFVELCALAPFVAIFL